jgi:nucleoid-associated protein YgaU
MKHPATIIGLLLLGYLLLRGRRSAAQPDGPPNSSTTYTVQRGDTLWSIARGRMPAGVSNAQIMAYVREIAVENGMNLALLDGRFSREPGDPDAIFPGQVLHIPPYRA